MTLRLSDLRPVCLKHPGMWDDFLSQGAFQAGAIEISRENFDAIQAKYFKGPRVGSAVHALLAPAVAVVDSVLGTKIGDCGDCGLRELKINDLTG